jgi:hypothetical protein
MRYDFLCPIPCVSLPIFLIPLIYSTSLLLLGAATFDPAHVHRLLQSIRHGGTPPEDRGRLQVHAPRMVSLHIQKKSLVVKFAKLISRIVVMITTARCSTHE